MYCSQCGTEAKGKFCQECGGQIHGANHATPINGQTVRVDNHVFWDEDSNYDNIIRMEPVRTAIANHAASAQKGISGEAILAIYDKIIASPIPLESLAAVLQPLYQSMGIKTGKELREVVRLPIGLTIASVLCSFAKNGQDFLSAQQIEMGCVLKAELPSSVCSLKGSLTVFLVKRQVATEVLASTVIPGQVYDWGKSQRCLQRLFQDLKSDLGLPVSQRLRAA